MAINQVPPEIMAKIQAAFAQGQGYSGVDPTTGLEWMSNVGNFGEGNPMIQQIIAGDPNHFSNSDPYLNFDTKTGAFAGNGTFEADGGFGSFLLKSGLGIAGLAMGAGAAFGGLGGGAAAGATGGGMDFGDIGSVFGGGDGGFGPFDSASLADPSGGFSLAGSDSSFNTAMLDSAGGGMGSSGGLLQNMLKGLGTGGGGAGGLGGISPLLQLLGPLAKFATSQQSNGVAQDMANKIIDRSDPFFQYRAGYGQKLANLESTHDVTQIPGYQAGLESVERAGASQGFTGSGNMMKALQDYGGNFFNTEANRLAGLAGAGATPGAGLGAAASLMGQGLGTKGYGIDSLMQALGGGMNPFTGLSQGGVLSQLFGSGSGGGGSTPIPSMGGLDNSSVMSQPALA